MDKNVRDALYDEICSLLKYKVGYDSTRMEYDLYKMLEKIRDNWEDIIAEE